MRFSLVLAALAACAGEPAPVAPTPVTSTPIDAGAVDAMPAVDAAPPIDEAHARVLLAERFRAAGMRVLYDVKVTGNGFELTCDGWSPERELGFEYLDPADAGDVSIKEGPWIGSDGRVLIVPPGSAEAVVAAADAFLAQWTAVDAGPQP